MHGSPPKAMQLGSTMITSTNLSKVKQSLYVCTAKNDCDTNFQPTNYVAQGGNTHVSTPVGKHEEVPKMMQYTHEQIVAFGGIQEEARRKVRSSGRLWTQPNADMTQMERVMMIAKKRVETPVIGMSTSKPTSITSFSEDQIIDNAMSLGVSLGVSHSDCIKSSKLIKDYEIQRSLTMLKCNEKIMRMLLFF
jgi:hypothetical protein